MGVVDTFGLVFRVLEIYNFGYIHTQQQWWSAMELIIALLDFSGVRGCQIDLISATLLFIQNGKGKA